MHVFVQPMARVDTQGKIRLPKSHPRDRFCEVCGARLSAYSSHKTRCAQHGGMKGYTHWQTGR